MSAKSGSKYDGRGAQSPDWWPSRYGAGDTLGSQNELTPERTLAALRIPVEGRTIKIGQVVRTVTDFQQPPRLIHQVVLSHWTTVRSTTSGANDMTGFEDQITLNSNAGCHLDGFAHNGIAGRAYNGLHYGEFFRPSGVVKFGMENVKPWVTRGVILNIAALHGVDSLASGYEITPDDLDAACKKQEVELHPGDVAVVHTGWGTLWDSDQEAYYGDEPGPGWDGSHWLTERQVSAVGADNWAFEVIPAPYPKFPFTSHQHLLSETGTYILENLRTVELAATGKSEFLLLMAPIGIAGLTSSPMSPVAVI